MKLEHVSFHYEDKPVIRDLTWDIPDKGVTAIRGVSGRGKSTLLKLMGGLLTPDAGTVGMSSPEKLRAEAAFLFQEDRLLPGLSVGQQIGVVLNKDADPGAVREALAWVGLEQEAEVSVDTLSGGMKRRLSLARALAYAKAEGKIRLILDEPFAGVDGKRAREIMAVIRVLDIPVIMAAHEADILAMADRILDLN